MKWTWEFQYYQFTFDRFNKTQEVIIPHLLKDVNLVISSGTATGKTSLIAGCFAYHLQTSDKKMVFISPLKSLSTEIYDNWNKDDQLNKYGIGIDTSDYKTSKEELLKNRVLILTNESFDSKTRNKDNYEWIKRVGCLVIDEAHLLGQKGRGDCLESVLMRFTEINKESRIIFLSATMSNGKQIAQWLKSLNDKSTLNITSKWRPVKLSFTFNYAEKWDEKIKTIVKIIEDNLYEKILIFVNSKKFGRELVKQLKKKYIMCVFHNAGLSHKRRKEIETAFIDRYSGLQVLVSTTTLACGVNV